MAESDLRLALLTLARALQLKALADLDVTGPPEDVRTAFVIAVRQSAASDWRKQRHACRLCGQEGHNARGCRGEGRGELYRCQVMLRDGDGPCDALVWRDERHMHLHDVHRVTVSASDIDPWFLHAPEGQGDDET
jgi:hypothetical protein